jgi:hypothetical protein
VANRAIANLDGGANEMIENDLNGSTKSGNFQLNFNYLISRKSKEFQIKTKRNHHRRQLPAIVSRAFILLPRKTLESLAAMISIDWFESARQSVLLAPYFSCYAPKKRLFTRESLSP